LAVQDDAAGQHIAHTGETLRQARRDDIGDTMRIDMCDGGDGVIDDDGHSGLRFGANGEQALEIDAAQQRIARCFAEQARQRLVLQQRAQIVILAVFDQRQEVRAAAEDICCSFSTST
jgi:hypothetical protein